MRIRVIFFLVLTCLTARADFLRNCRDLLLVVTNNYDYAVQRSRDNLPLLIARYKDEWNRKLGQVPESALNLSPEKALGMLTPLRALSRKDIYLPGSIANPDWGNVAKTGAFEGMPIIVKTTQQRTSAASVGDGRVNSWTSFAKYETIAYALDRYLEMNSIPPCVMMNDGATASLWIPGRAVDIQYLEKSPENIMFSTHLRFLDLLMANPDRSTPKNAIETKNGQPVGIDFDASKLYLYDFGIGAPIDFLIKRLHLEPQKKWLWGYSQFPGVISQRVYENLKKLDEEALLKLAREHGFLISQKEIKNILDSRQQILMTVENWKQIYGDSIVIPYP